jgi:hypothetical protein
LHAKKMLNNRRTLVAAGRFHGVSPNARDVPYRGVAGVLAIWPSSTLVEFASEIAQSSALCVIPYRHDVSWWIERTNAINLLTAEASTPIASAPAAVVTEALDSILFFGGSNSFLGGGEKDDAVGKLRGFVDSGLRPEADAIENYARASGETDVEGARRLRDWYEAILAGRGLRGERGKPI